LAYKPKKEVYVVKATWAMKITRCLECGEDIVPTEEGTRRLTDTIFLLTTQRVTRVHYHPECYEVRANRWWGENPYNPLGRGGRRAMPISHEAMKRRRTLLKRMSYLRRTYSDDARRAVADIYQRLNSADTVAEALDGLNMDRQEVYYTLKKETKEILNELSSAEMGGLPKHLINK
tara:strand:+ start:623 stop:1150 length:528 start_codon:yes stop_codon:yes gene_type:complete